MKLTGMVRYRLGLFGRLVLQVQAADSVSTWWRDAKIEDLAIDGTIRADLPGEYAPGSKRDIPPPPVRHP